jgi:hypothetical protein
MAHFFPSRRGGALNGASPSAVTPSCPPGSVHSQHTHNREVRTGAPLPVPVARVASSLARIKLQSTKDKAQAADTARRVHRSPLSGVHHERQSSQGRLGDPLARVDRCTCCAIEDARRSRTLGHQDAGAGRGPEPDKLSVSIGYTHTRLCALRALTINTKPLPHYLRDFPASRDFPAFSAISRIRRSIIVRKSPSSTTETSDEQEHRAPLHMYC